MKGETVSVHRFFPRRIVCLSHDAVETLLALDAVDSIAGRPSGCRKSVLGHVPTVGGYGRIDIEKVLRLRPELVITYADFHDAAVARLVAAHVTVLAQNHTDIEGIFRSILMVGGMVGRAFQAMSLVATLAGGVARVRESAAGASRRPRVYFEEWPDPPTCGARWISQMIDTAGGEDIFAERALCPKFGSRAVSADEVAAANPDIFVASWCGRRFAPEAVKDRPGWDRIAAVRADRMFEMNANTILQPGPRFIEGLERLRYLLTAAAERP